MICFLATILLFVNPLSSIVISGEDASRSYLTIT